MDNSEFFNPGKEAQSTMNIELLGYPKQSGAMCEVYRVRRFGKQLMMKRLLPCHATKQQYQLAFRKEFEMGYLLEHQNLIRYHEWGEDEQGPFILMEYIDGWTLREFLTSVPDYFDDIENEREFIKQLLSVLGYLHSHQIIYLDLKPDNILITRIGRKVKLIDLGCSYSDTFTDTAGLNQNFAAPEQRSTTKSPHFSPQTDLYALGRLLKWISESSTSRLSTSAKSLTKKLLIEQIEKRPNSTESAWQIYRQKKDYYLRLFSVIFLLIIVVTTLFLFRPKPEIETATHDIPIINTIDIDTGVAEVAKQSEPKSVEKLKEIKDDTIVIKPIPPSKVYSLENARKYIAEEIYDGREETQLFICEIDSVLQSFYSNLDLQFTPLTLNNYQEFVDRRIDFGFKFRHLVDEASSRYGISSTIAEGVSQRLYECFEMAEMDRLWVFRDAHGLLPE